ncbi:MAG: Crp/Fnr family transcriptional regulator [Terriglobia bacterium]
MSRHPTPYGLEIVQSCLACAAREEGLFCNLGPEALKQLDAIRQLSTYPKGATLFVEGQEPRGIYILCAGSVKLTATSARGNTLIVRVAEKGEVLGLSAAVSRSPHEGSAETLEPTEVSFLPQEAFLSFLESRGEVAVRVAQHLSMELRRAYQQVTRIALAPTARAKLAGLLLEWSRQHGQPGRSKGFHLRLTHEDVGALIGASRETVTRILSDFRREGLIETSGSFIALREASKLEAILD